MGWLLTKVSKVVGGGDESLSEYMVPDAVDDDADSQWIILAQEVLGKLEPCRLVESVRCLVDGFKEASGDGFTGFFMVTADE